jgi:hypothetical protein
VLIDPAEHLIYVGKQNHYAHPDGFVYFCAAEGNKFGIQKRTINMYDPTTNKVLQLDKDDPRVEELSAIWKHDCMQYATFLEKNTKYNTIIIEDYYEMRTAELFSKIKHNFISDIRTNIYDGKRGLSSSKPPPDLDVVWNLAMMYAWVRVQQPMKSMIKYRLPYFNKGELELFNSNCNKSPYVDTFNICKEGNNPIDFVHQYRNKQTTFIKGTDYIQAYCDVLSGETRLWFDQADIGTIEQIDYLDREQKLFYYNSVQRPYGWYKNDIDTIEGIDRCGDCALAMQILTEYNSKCGSTKSVPTKQLGDIMHTLNRSLIKNNHGYYMVPVKNTDDIYSIRFSIDTRDFFQTNSITFIQNLSPNYDIEKAYKLWQYLHTCEYNIKNNTKRLKCLNKSMLYRSLIQFNPSVHSVIIEYYKAKIKRRYRDDDDSYIKEIMDNYNADIPTPYNLIVTVHNDRTTYEYGEFKLEVSPKWWFHNSLSELILTDHTLYDGSGILVCSPALQDIFSFLSKDYTTIVEISSGYNSILNNIPNYTYYNYIFNNTEVMPEINNKTIVYIHDYLSHILAESLSIHCKNSLIITSTTTRHHLSSKLGWSFIEPYNALNFMYQPIIEDRYTRYLMTGNMDTLDKLQNKFGNYT